MKPVLSFHAEVGSLEDYDDETDLARITIWFQGPGEGCNTVSVYVPANTLKLRQVVKLDLRTDFGS